jgi:hypothetical protein
VRPLPEDKIDEPYPLLTVDPLLCFFYRSLNGGTLSI